MARTKATAGAAGKRAKTAEGAAPSQEAADAKPRSRGRPPGTVGKSVADGRTERIYVSVKPAQRRKLEDDLIELKRQRKRPANYALSQYVYELLEPLLPTE